MFDQEYFRERTIRSHHYLLAEALLTYFDGCNTFFDYGCGEGFMIHAFKYSEPELIIEGYDPNLPYFIPFSKSEGLISISIPDNKTYDVVICMDVLEHVNDDKVESIINDLVRLAEKYIFVSVCSSEIWWNYPDKTHINFKTKSFWNKRFLSRGLVGLEVPKSFLFPEQMLLYKKEVLK